MAEPNLIAFKGKTSQTGLAAQVEFPGIEFQGGNETFDVIAELIRQKSVLAVLPMWNSHEGEITKSRVLDLLFQNQARLYRIWPKVIQFECIGKSTITIKNIRKVVSVGVAKTQCSRFIKRVGAEFMPVEATTVAYKMFCNEDEIDTALCAPGQNELGFKLLCADASNPMNFTSFVLLGSLDSEVWDIEQWRELFQYLNPKKAIYFGVEMASRMFSSEDQEAFLDNLTEYADTINEIPKVIFVTERYPNRCGLLIESSDQVLGTDILIEEGYSTEVRVNPYLGHTKERYPQRIGDFFDKNFKNVVKHDFVRHIGTQTCLFACPAFGIVTHGFDEHIVEPVVKRIITKYFELLDIGIGCLPSQRKFFLKHKKAYYDQGMDFINFIDVGL